MIIVYIERAFMGNLDVLVLDEPTSSLDPISEREIFLNIEKA